MKTIEIYGANRQETYTKVREACRGIVVREGMLLMSYETKTGLWMIPGGGVEGTETLEPAASGRSVRRQASEPRPRNII